MVRNSVGLVIPARNEEKYLSVVLDIVREVDWLEQIILVDDHSTDGTYSIARRYAGQDRRLVVTRLDRNRGKSGAMLEGVKTLAAGIEDVIFLDADLVEMKASHIEELYRPLLSGQCDMAVAVFRHGALRTDAGQIVTPNLSGQRCLKRAAADKALALLENSGFGVEIGLTAYARHHHWVIKYIPWIGVTHVVQEHKRGLIRGLMTRSVMYGQILATMINMPQEKNGKLS